MIYAANTQLYTVGAGADVKIGLLFLTLADTAVEKALLACSPCWQICMSILFAVYGRVQIYNPNGLNSPVQSVPHLFLSILETVLH